MKLSICTAYLIEEQGISYLAENGSNSGLRPLQASAYRIALGPPGRGKVLNLQDAPSRQAPCTQPGCFNVSHSKDVAVYAFALGRQVGIDVEAVHGMNDADSIAARFFSQFENKAYLALDPRDMPVGFF